MAVNRPEVDIIGEGMSLTDPYCNQTYIQNLFKSKGFWETREGLGTIAEFCGPLNAMQTPYIDGKTPAQVDLDYEFGLKQILGSFIFETEFGNTQIITIFLAHGNTAYEFRVNDDLVDYYCAIIYDVTTNNIWKEILYVHTSEETQTLQTEQFYRGYYETRKGLYNFMDVSLAKENYFFFHSYLNKVYFGNSFGIWQYNPSAFTTNKEKQINTTNHRNEVNDALSNPYGETGLIIPVAFKDGIFAEDNAYTYVQNSDLSAFVDATSINGRIVYASGKSIYFSDIGVSNAIMGDNVFTFHELRNDIVAIENLNNNILVWSKDEMFIFSPSQGIILSAGRAVKVHDEVGCLSPACVIQREGLVTWVDENGVYQTATGLNLEILSLPIKRFFDGETINPVTHYFTETGHAPATAIDRPDFIYKANENYEGMHLAYDRKEMQLILVVPKLNIMWVYKNGWYLWSTTSVVKDTAGGAPALIGATTQVSNPRVVSFKKRTFAIGGKQTFKMHFGDYEAPHFSDDPLSYNTSFRIFELGRGGARDGNTNDFTEGIRSYGAYRHIKINTAANRYEVYLDKIFPHGGYLSDKATNSTFYYEQPMPAGDLWLMPIRITPIGVNTSGSPLRRLLKYDLSFRIDAQRWQPVAWTGGANDAHQFLLPPERVGTYLGYDPTGAAGLATRHFRYDATTGMVNIAWDSTGAGVNLAYGYMQLQEGNKNDIIYLPLQKIRRTSDVPPSTNIVIEASVTASFYTTDGEEGEVDVTDYNLFAWDPGWYKLENDESRTQALDWVYKSSQIGIEGQQQVKARGSFSSIISRGPGTKTDPGWLWGLWNSICGSDYKDYVTQNIDFDGTSVLKQDIERIAEKASIRNRWLNTTVPANPILTKRLFDSTDPAPAQYGSNAAPTTGNFLVDTEEVDTIATSDSVRGGSVNYTFFGFLQDKAQKLIIKNIKIAINKVSGRRRTGR